MKSLTPVSGQLALFRNIHDFPHYLRLRYDEGGRLSRVEVDRGMGAGFFDALTSVAYDARGKATRLVFGNGVQTTREHDAALERLTRLYTKLPGTPKVEHQDLRYAYDPTGHILNIEDALSESSFKDNKLIPNSRGFSYDARYRLVRATGRKHNSVFDRSTGVLVPSPEEGDYVPYDLRYAYDEVGNFRINQEYASSGKAHLNYKADRIDLFNGSNTEAIDPRPEHGNFRYDDNGSVTHTPRQQELGYAFDGQPVYVDLGGGGKVRYFRHGDQRVVRMVNKPGVMAVGVYLGPWEYHGRQGTVSFDKVVLHVHGEGKVAQVERVLDGADPDSLEVFYVHEDHLGSGHVLTDEAGALLSQEETFAYGRASDRLDARNRYRWIGVERDEDTGLCLTGPRLYDPVVGRFGSGDPVVQAGRSPFGYAGGEPIGRRDPGGYQDEGVPALPAATSETAGTAGAGVVSGHSDTLRRTSEVQQSNRDLQLSSVKTDVATFAERDDEPAPQFGATRGAWLVVPYGQRQKLGAILGGKRVDPNIPAKRRAGRSDDHADELRGAVPYEVDCGISTVEAANNNNFRLSNPAEGVSGRITDQVELGPPSIGATRSLTENLLLLDAIDEELYKGNMVLLGVDHKPGAAGPNISSDGITDHWLHVVGRTYDTQGRAVYVGVDNASGPAFGPRVVYMYVDAATGRLHKPGVTQQPWGQLTTNRPWTASNARRVYPR